jgi:hypothetical protein
MAIALRVQRKRSATPKGAMARVIRFGRFGRAFQHERLGGVCSAVGAKASSRTFIGDFNEGVASRQLRFVAGFPGWKLSLGPAFRGAAAIGP